MDKRTKITFISMTTIGLIATGAVALNKTYTVESVETIPAIAVSVSEKEGYQFNGTSYVSTDREISYVAPEGYVLEGDKCVKISESDTNSTEKPENNYYYMAPEGYVLEGTNATKKIKVKKKGYQIAIEKIEDLIK